MKSKTRHGHKKQVYCTNWPHFERIRNQRKMIQLRRAQIGKYRQADAIDVTVISSKGKHRPLAPTWGLVRDCKAKRITESQYTLFYREILADVPRDTLVAIYRIGQKHGTITFLCCCPAGQVCHTYLLIDWLVEHYPHVYEAGNPVDVLDVHPGQMRLP
jgi:hypothetical protein